MKYLSKDSADYIYKPTEFASKMRKWGTYLGIKPFAKFPGMRKFAKMMEKIKKQGTDELNKKDPVFLCYWKLFRDWQNDESVARKIWDSFAGNYILNATGAAIIGGSMLMNDNNEQNNTFGYGTGNY